MCIGAITTSKCDFCKDCIFLYEQLITEVIYTNHRAGRKVKIELHLCEKLVKKYAVGQVTKQMTDNQDIVGLNSTGIVFNFYLDPW